MLMDRRKISILLLFSVWVTASLRLESPAQIRPVYDQGALGLTRLFRSLDTNARALMIGAHPDDEDTALLAYLARGESARTGYLSLTRGDGGQNIIGPELGEALGIIRTEELLQARKLDGAEQFFTRAYDYGFSKTLAEAKQKWDERVVLCDVVEAIRAFKPQVVIAQFTGTPSDGHGQHQYAGYITPLAVKAASDASQCADRGDPWMVIKLFVRHRGQGEPALRINTGRYDSLLGRSYFEIAMHARSQHRSQEQGALELKGDQYSQLNLVIPPAVPRGKQTGIFDGIDVTSGKPLLGQGDSGISGHERIVRLLERLPPSETDPLYATARRAILAAAGVRIDVLADRETAVAGESVPVVVRMYTPFTDLVKVSKVEFSLPFAPAPEPPAPQSQFFRREVGDFNQHYTITIPNTAPATQPFWLLEPRRGDPFFIPPGRSATRPFHDSAVAMSMALQIGNRQITFHKPVEYRYADDVRGEIRRELSIVPKITVAPDKNLLIVSTRAKHLNRELSIAVTNNATGPASGKVRLVLPEGWKSSPIESEFAMSRKGETSSAKVTINIPRTAAGAFEIRAEAVSGGASFLQSMQTIAYEHIETHRIYRPAKVDVRLIDVQTALVKVGYIRGSGDRVPEAIEQLGLGVEEIDDSILATGDLSRFDTIVVGIRAYQVRPALAASNQRLLDFAGNGGTLVVQYQLPPTFSQLNMPPFPVQMGPRVADENAPVTILDPTHQLLSYPNKINTTDFEGWVQERNLYNFSTMDPRYVGLLESHDAGEAENRGGLVVADIGKGKYVYCSYSLFRQLPAGVPGAYRLLANLLSLPRAGGRK